MTGDMVGAKVPAVECAAKAGCLGGRVKEGERRRAKMSTRRLPFQHADMIHL